MCPFSSDCSYPFASIKQRAALYFVLPDKPDRKGLLQSGATSESFKGSICQLGTLQLKEHVFQMRSELTRMEKNLRKDTR